MAFKDTTERNAMNYYISDLHIGHENILRFDNRPFADVNEMNNKLIENWNARVRSDDTVYILGDFIWAKESEWPSIVGSLGGNKVLIRGNHDPKQFSASTKRMFQEITDLKEIKDSGKHVVMCHYPIPFFRASFASTAFMLYGHVHQTIEYEYIAKLRREVKANSTGYGTPNGNFINVGCMMPYIPLWAVTLIGGLFIWVLSFVMIMSVYGRFFKMYMYTALAPVPLSAFAGEPTQNIGKSFLKSYASVCLEGAIIVLACIIFSVFASSPPVVDPNAAPASMVWSYIGELIFNMLILVGAVKMADRLVKEMMGI